jgi:hypothetical protein
MKNGLSSEEMTYSQAAKLLEKHFNSVKAAVERGTLTPLPKKGFYRPLLTKQVQLFIGKPISLSALTPDEYKVWEECAKMAKGDTEINNMQKVVPKEENKDLSLRIPMNFNSGIFSSMCNYDKKLEKVLISPLAHAELSSVYSAINTAINVLGIVPLKQANFKYAILDVCEEYPTIPLISAISLTVYRMFVDSDSKRYFNEKDIVNLQTEKWLHSSNSTTSDYAHA